MQVLDPRMKYYDISLGAENVPVIVTCREGTGEFPEPFKYIRTNHFHKDVSPFNPNIGKGVFCTKCVSSCGIGKCCCCDYSGGVLPPYTEERLLHPHYIETVPPINPSI